MAKAPFLVLGEASWESGLTSVALSESLLIYRVCTLYVRRRGEYRGTAPCESFILLTWSVLICSGSSHQHYLIPPVAGPMATSLATTEYFMESLLASSPWNVDPNVVPIPWRKELAIPPANRKLRLGVVFDDGVVKPQPPVARAMRETVDALRAAGHEGIYTPSFFLSLHLSFPPVEQVTY